MEETKMEHMQDVFKVLGIQELDLPQIAVVGMQSSGKSTVLERLVGRTFLPRGPGGVTKCPLVLHLVNSRGNSATEDYGIFQHKKTELFEHYQLISEEIEEQTRLLTSGCKDVCSTSISLTIFSKAFANLTLVDLPGITIDNKQQTKELILKYIDKPNCLILVVTPANADMETCEGLKIAREVDPEGVRTLVIVTKLDLMTVGTARGVLHSISPVKHGVIGLVNQSEKSIVDNHTIKQTLLDEREFFKKNYEGFESFHGLPYLIKTIQTILLSHILPQFPGLKDKIGRKLEYQKLKLCVLGFAQSDSDRVNFLQNVIFKFSYNFRATISGTSDYINTKELSGAVKINEIFSIANNALKNMNLRGLSENDIKMALSNGFGVNVACYIPSQVFELLAKKQIKQLGKPCLTCVHIVHEELINMVYNCVNDPNLQIENYPKLQNMLSMTALDFLEHQYLTTIKFVNNIIDIHLAYINYNHLDFLPNHIPLDEPAEDIIVTSHNEKSFCDSIINHLDRYLCTVRVSIMDILPKLVMCSMVKSMAEGLHPKLMSRLNDFESSDLLQESPKLLQKRKMINKAISVLEKADSILNSLKNSDRACKNLTKGARINNWTKEFCNNLYHNRVWFNKNNIIMLIVACLVLVVGCAGRYVSLFLQE